MAERSRRRTLRRDTTRATKSPATERRPSRCRGPAALAPRVGDPTRDVTPRSEGGPLPGTVEADDLGTYVMPPEAPAGASGSHREPPESMCV
ncbi:hypothetical protein GTY69_00130 [Streptomyces sp. SID8364]|nr:hypothetical protein [Streptomyces sp. SID8364]